MQLICRKLLKHTASQTPICLLSVKFVCDNKVAECFYINTNLNICITLSRSSYAVIKIHDENVLLFILADKNFELTQNSIHGRKLSYILMPLEKLSREVSLY